MLKKFKNNKIVIEKTAPIIGVMIADEQIFAKILLFIRDLDE